MANTVLSPANVGGFQTAHLMAQVGNVFQQLAASKSQSIDNAFQQDINSIERDADRWKKIQVGIDNANAEINDTLNRAKTVARYIDDMIANIKKAGLHSGDSGFNATGYAATLDSQLRSLNYKVQDGRTVGMNLLDQHKSDFTFTVGIHGTQTTVSGSYIGTEYYIIDSNNNRWQPDLVAKNLKQYSDYPDTPTSNVGNFQTGIRVDSVVGDAINFTIGQDTATPQSFSGTMYRSGLKVMNSWFYDGLSTQAGRDLALADLANAKEAATLEVSRYQTALTANDFYTSLADTVIKGYRTESQELLIEKAAALGKEQQNLNNQYQSAIGSIGQALAQKRSYAKMFLPFIDSRFTKIFNLSV